MMFTPEMVLHIFTEIISYHNIITSYMSPSPYVAIVACSTCEYDSNMTDHYHCVTVASSPRAVAVH